MSCSIDLWIQSTMELHYTCAKKWCILLTQGCTVAAEGITTEIFNAFIVVYLS